MMQEQRPTQPFALSLIAGVVILIAMVFIHEPPVFLFNVADPAELTSIWFLIFGVIMGLAVIIGAIMLYFQPKQHVVWSVIVLVFTFLGTASIVGLLVVLPLGIAGAILGITWSPAEGTITPLPIKVQAMQEVSSRARCPRCDRTLLQDVKNCPYCGLELKQ